MTTVDPQLIHSLINSVALLTVAMLLGVVFRLALKTRRQKPSDSLVHELRADVERFTGMVADLEERFSRFQKREGMRHARSQKETDRDLLAEATQLAAGSQPQQSQNNSTGSSKAELYRRARGLNS